ncbi:site-specific DNA-methyltransferase [Erwinia amylovora]|uniref:site-specific DNA-methyltransferase n=3 Tax=Erwinia amylovora TaxID=552 RepID=UPI000C08A5E4|nr:site-specific DNA-methyltransferase [Erwinia amylovora]MBZ2398951.1 site-specific DNA-methyltransferase [Erwinia amylovora]MBZ2402669.1 site-specific DNA-methyltransferase [Erwinia amylovora]UDJ87536.1 site-specific DNA-methyltransferase [Erwinia amylovora]UDJ98994.1 site-specific DNA-methyltransferase [Erwinia amylovora]UDK88949.1 site-specific DNA-methyltransferase [Erwinia amylovora]
MPFLDWVNKNQAKAVSTAVPYHLLQKEAEFGTPAKDNMIIQGDNLLALRALMPLYAGQVKCIFIDPPYNTQSAFEHYDDKLEHSQWLSMMYPRLVLLRDLLAEDGSIWVTIDDNEAHYMKVMMDEVFGRENFIANLVWRKNYAPKSSAKHFSVDHDHIFVFAKKSQLWSPNPMPRSDKQNKAYKNPDNDPRGNWRPNNLAARNYYSKGTYPITCPGGRIIDGPPHGSYWRVSEEKFRELDKDNRIWWGKDGNNVPAPKIFLSEVKQGVVPQTFWSYEEVGHTQEAKKEIVNIFKSEVFDTPKPERLVERVLHVASKDDDLVLDSFLGSGTTAAVAHKMNRRYIGIEMGEHARTHCIPRLQKVIAGEQGGISQSVEWQGGGGCSFYTLNPEPVFQPNGRICPDIKFAPLAAYIWHHETGTGAQQTMDKPCLGVHNGTAWYLLYNGILGDRRPNGGNVLTRALLAWLLDTFPHNGPKIIYGETSRIGPERLAQANVTFKQIPYDIVLR